MEYLKYWIREFCTIWIVVWIVVRIMELLKFWIVVWIMGRLRFWIAEVFFPMWIVKDFVRCGLQFFRKVERSAANIPPWMQQDFVDLAEIFVWERPVDYLRSSYQSGKVKGSGILKHDYIVIKLASGDSFVAEKVAEPVKCGILSCEYVMITSAEGPPQGHNCRFKVNLKGARVGVEDLINVLQAEGHEYELMSHNCWAYAYFTAEKVIKLCEKGANLSTADRESIQKVFHYLGGKKRIMPRTLVSLLFSLLFYLIPTVSNIFHRPRLCFSHLLFSLYLTQIERTVMVFKLSLSVHSMRF